MMIGRFESRDAVAVSTLIRTTMQVSNAADCPTEKLQPLIEYFSPQKVEQLSHERHSLVAEDGDKIVGTVALEDGALVTFFVHPAYQGQGIGSALLEAIETFAVTQGVAEIQVESSLTGVDFYHSRGYNRTGKVIEGTAGSQIQMCKELIQGVLGHRAVETSAGRRSQRDVDAVPALNHL